MKSLLCLLLLFPAVLRAADLDPAITVGDVTLVRYAEGSYESTSGRTYYSGTEIPSAEDAAVAVATPRSAPLPAPPIPEVTRRQLFLWLNAQGHTRAQIRAIIEAIPDATAREAALIEFDEAQSFQRTHALIGQLAAALGHTSAQIDDAFRAAALL